MFSFFYFDEVIGKTVEVSREQVESEFNLSMSEFEQFGTQVRIVWHKQEEKFYFSVVDVVQVLTESVDGRKYWNKLKQRLVEEGNQLVTICHQLKMKSLKDGKFYNTDAADIEGILRIIQSIPSPKAEPFKMWLAELGKERIDEMIDPEIAIDRAVDYYKQKGYSDKWITQRLRAIEIRKELTEEWQRSGVSEKRDFALLTDMLTHAWSGMSTRQYKDFKGLKKENLRDNMTNTELALNLLAEVATTELSKDKNPKGLEETKDITKQGGSIAGNARKELESVLGRKIISPANAKDMKLLNRE